MGNITSDTFNPIRAYCNVRLQQGVPLIDADVNELDDIRKFELRAFLKWVVGNGVPEGTDGFHVVAMGSATDFAISAGGPGGAAAATTVTTATYVQPANGASVTVSVVGVSWLAAQRYA